MKRCISVRYLDVRSGNVPDVAEVYVDLCYPRLGLAKHVRHEGDGGGGGVGGEEGRPHHEGGVDDGQLELEGG